MFVLVFPLNTVIVVSFNLVTLLTNLFVVSTIRRYFPDNVAVSTVTVPVAMIGLGEFAIPYPCVILVTVPVPPPPPPPLGNTMSVDVLPLNIVIVLSFFLVTLFTNLLVVSIFRRYGLSIELLSVNLKYFPDKPLTLVSAVIVPVATIGFGELAIP